MAPKNRFQNLPDPEEGAGPDGLVTGGEAADSPADPGADDDKAAAAAGGGDGSPPDCFDSSPLNALRCLLNLYSLVGIIPGWLSPDGCSFTVRCVVASTRGCATFPTNIASLNLVTGCSKGFFFFPAIPTPAPGVLTLYK